MRSPLWLFIKYARVFSQCLSAPFHKYRQNALIDATVALMNGASLTLTSIGHFLPGKAQVKNKIKRVDRPLGNESLPRWPCSSFEPKSQGHYHH